MDTIKWATALLAGFLLLMLSTNLYAATCKEIESALESAREDLRISIATEERIISDLAKLKKSGDTPPDIIKDYELYLHRVHAMVAEKRRLVGRMEALSAKYDVHKTPDGSTGSKDTSLMTKPVIPEEQVVDEVDILDHRLDGSLAEFDEMLLKELDLIQAKSSERMRDLAEEAAAAAERLRNKGIDITADVEGESTVSAQEKTEKEKGGTFVGLNSTRP